MIGHRTARNRQKAKKKRMAVAVKRVAIDFPEPLLRETEEVASQLEINRSNLIRDAVEEYLKVVRRKRLELELAVACEANAEFERQICDEFAHVDSENI